MRVARTETMVTLLLQTVQVLEIQLVVASKKHLCQEFTLRLHSLSHTNRLTELTLHLWSWITSSGCTLQYWPNRGLSETKHTSVFMTDFHPRVKAVFSFTDRGNMAEESSSVTHTGRLKSEATNACLVLLQGLATATLILWFKTQQREIEVHNHNANK